MRRKITLLLLAIICICTFGISLTACKTHVHSYKWQFNDDYHWEVCSGCNETKQDSLAQHQSEDGIICKICNCHLPSLGVIYSKNNDESYSVTGINNDTETEIYIRTVYEGLPVTGISDSAFRNCSEIRSVTLPETITSIGNYAFQGCSDLRTVTLGNNIQSIGEQAFCNCIMLTSISIPNSVTDVGNNVFKGCYQFLSISIGSGVTNINIFELSRCQRLVSIDVDKNNTVYASQDGILYNSDKTEILHIPMDIKGSVTIPSTIEQIGNYAFYERYSLESIILPDSITGIGINAFYGCAGLTNVTMSNSITSIGTNAFGGCFSLEYNESGNGLYLGNNKNPYLVLLWATDSNVISCTISKNTKIVMPEAFNGCDKLTSIAVDKDNETFASQDGILYNYDKTTVLRAPNKISGSVSIPDSVETVASGAFGGCSEITSITFGNSLQRIEDCAFDSCTSLSSIILPNSLQYIGGEVFRECYLLNTITFKGTMEQWDAIDKDMLWNFGPAHIGSLEPDLINYTINCIGENGEN